jgi:hypothetical protein
MGYGFFAYIDVCDASGDNELETGDIQGCSCVG